MTNKNKTMTKIGIFIVGVCLCGWLGKAIDMILIDQPKGQSLGSLIWLISPAILSLILVLLFDRPSRYMGLRGNLKGNTGLYLLAVLIFPVLAVVLLFLGCLSHVIVLQNDHVDKILSAFVMWFVISFFRTILEEIAWRGYLTERLLRWNISDWKLYAGVTFVWGTWHIPYYLFFFHNGNAVGLITSCYFNLACWSLLFTEIYRWTRSIWPCVLLHAAANAVQYLMLEDYFVISANWNILLLPGTGILSCGICIIAGMMVRSMRIKREP